MDGPLKKTHCVRQKSQNFSPTVVPCAICLMTHTMEAALSGLRTDSLYLFCQVASLNIMMLSILTNNELLLIMHCTKDISTLKLTLNKFIWSNLHKTLQQILAHNHSGTLDIICNAQTHSTVAGGQLFGVLLLQ